MTEIVQAADGEYTTNGTPRGATSLTPFLVIPDARGAIDFYRDVFGARVVDVTEMGGVVAHAVLDFGNGLLQLGEPMPAYGLIPPPDGDNVCYSIGLYCPDVDAVVARAEAASATVREAPSTFVSGDRFASIRDPFGVRWSVMTRVEDISEEESARRVAEWAKRARPSKGDSGRRRPANGPHPGGHRRPSPAVRRRPSVAACVLTTAS